MSLFNYYFYRVHAIFLKKKEYARITTCIIFCELFLTAFFFISIFTSYYITGEFFSSHIPSYLIYLTLFGATALFGVILYAYYSKSRIIELQKRYSKSKYNKLISDKFILSVSYIELTLGFILWFVIANI